jgi:hypothetical protein
VTERTCRSCGVELTRKTGPGRWPVWCEACRAANAPSAAKREPRGLCSCGRKIVPPRRRFCSDRCVNRELRSEGYWRRSGRERGHCITCGIAVPALPDGRAAWKCAQCKAIRAAERDRVRQDAQAGAHRISYVDCVRCGAVEVRHTSKGRATFCSECRKAARSDRNRRKNAQRRGAAKGVPYTLGQVAERDGYRCHLPDCGRKVNMALPGSHPMGPTIDHLIPISAGGLDCLTNVRLAHRACNCRRQCGGAVQLLLVG